MIGQVVSGLLALVAAYILLCRVDKMLVGVTRPGVFLQHAILALGMFASFVLPFTPWATWAPAAAAAGVCAFLLLSKHRWEKGAPDDTSRPIPLEWPDLGKVSGGRREPH